MISQQMASVRVSWEHSGMGFPPLTCWFCRQTAVELTGASEDIGKAVQGCGGLLEDGRQEAVFE